MKTQLFTEIREGSFFRKLGGLSSVELANCLRWAPLLTTDSLEKWLKNGGAVKALKAPRCAEAWYTALGVVLERHLLNIETRFNPEGFFEFWDWTTSVAKINGNIASVWKENEAEIRGSCKEGTLTDRDIISQETTFSQVLLSAEQRLKQVPGKLQWAAKTVAKLAARRSGGSDGKLPHRAFARVVFAFEETIAKEIRPAILIDFELGKQGCEPYIESGEVFDKSFHESVKFVAEQHIRRNFHQLRYQSPGLELEAESLTGESGGLAILLAQILANRSDGRWQKHWYGLPPWVVVTTTLDPNAEGRVNPVGAIEAKVKLLREEGVRVVVVANASEQLTAVDNLLATFKGQHGIEKFRTESTPKATAEQLIKQRFAWPVDIEKAPLFTRRDAIGATVAIAGSCLAIGSILFRPDPIPVPTPRPQTVAMKKGLGLQSVLKARADEIKNYRSGFDIKTYFHDVLKATEIKKAPAETSFRGLKILLDSKFFDSTDWKEVSSLDELTKIPIEPAYFTRVLRLKKEENSPSAIAVEFNTGGLCVVPVMDEARGDKVYYSSKQMNESNAPERKTWTTYLVIDISKLGTDGKPFDLVVNAIWLNGTQDQQLRTYKDGPKKGQKLEYDWWGTRVAPGTERADLAIRLPESRAFGNIKRYLRKEDQETSRLVPVQEVREDDPGQLEPTYTESPVSVWTFPCKRDQEQGYHWIYSIQWEWEQPNQSQRKES